MAVPAFAVARLLAHQILSGLLSVDVGKNPVTGANIREQRYRINDNYARFYLKFIEPVKDTIDSGAFVFSDLNALKGWPSIMGLAFENMVVNHVRDLLVPLHLENVLVTSAAPYVKKGSRKSGFSGCQVDLLIRTALVYDGDLDPVVPAQGYFDAIVSFDRLLGI